MPSLNVVPRKSAATTQVIVPRFYVVVFRSCNMAFLRIAPTFIVTLLVLA
jgi:hypothetical protein